MVSQKMVGFILIMLLLPFLNSCAAGNKSYQLPYPNEGARLVTFPPGSEPYGIGGINWGADISVVQGMEHYRTDKSHGGIEFYVKKGEALRIGGETFDKVQYGFWSGKFYVGMIKTDGPARWDVLKKAIFKHYGEGAKPFKNREEYLWTGENVIMALRYDEDIRRGIFYIRSISISNQMIQEKN